MVSDAPRGKSLDQGHAFRLAVFCALIVLHAVWWFALSAQPSGPHAPGRAVLQSWPPVLWIAPLPDTERDARASPAKRFPTRPAVSAAAPRRPAVRRVGEARPTALPRRPVSERYAGPAAATPADVATRSTSANTAGEPEKEPGAASVRQIDYGKMAGVLKSIGHDAPSRADLAPDKTETATDKLGRNFAKAKRLDCETAHAHLGLLAIPFLLIDTVTDTGCHW